MPVTGKAKRNSLSKLDDAAKKSSRPRAILDRRHSSPFPESEQQHDEPRHTLSRWNSERFPVTEARFHRSEDASLESSHVLEHLEKATSNDNSKEGPVLLQALSCEETVCDESISKIQEIFQKNHENIFLRQLSLPNNQLSSAAAGPIAKILQITETLMHLDIRNNKVGCEGLAKLIQPLTELGGDKCSLITLNLANNNLRRKAASAISLLLKNNKTIQELHLGQNPLKPQGMKEILNGLQANGDSKVRHLDLKTTSLGRKAGLNALIELLKWNETIESLDLSSNALGPQGAIDFSQVFMYKNALLDLNLGSNDIGPEGGCAIANALNEDGKLQGHCHLQRLTLDWNQMGDEGTMFLAVCLEKNSTLQYIDLSNNNIGSDGAIQLSKTFGITYCLKEVLLNDNKMDDQGAFALASALGSKNCSIEKMTWDTNPGISDQDDFFLNHVFVFRESLKTWLGKLKQDMKADRCMSLDWWRTEHVITDWEVAALAQTLADHKPRMLASMWLTGQRVTDQSLEILFSSYLAENPRLQRLYLKSVTIKDAMSSLQKALSSNSTLRILSLTCCGLSAADAATLAVALQQNMTLERLSLQGNEIGDEGFRFLWKAINPKGKTPHKSLLALDVRNNQLTDAAMVTLRASASVGTLKHLYLDQNQITDAGALDLARAIMESPTLKALSVTQNGSMTERGRTTLRMFAPGQCSS